MSPAKLGLLAALVGVNVVFVVAWVRDAHQRSEHAVPRLGDIAIGFITDFLDALGIGSFASTTTLFKLRGDPPDELIPGTLNIGHNASAFLETAVFVTSVAVEPVLLAAMVASATLGAWLGAGVVSRWPRRIVQLSMGFALLLALLGLHPLGAFPIMMGTCGLVQPVASLRFFKTGRFAFGPAPGITLGGCVGVLVAIFIVRQLPLVTLRWLVIVVVLHAAVSMLRSALHERAAALVTT